MKKRKSKILENSISPFLLLNTAIASQTMSEDKYRKQVATFLVNEIDSKFEERFEKLLTTKRFKNLITSNALTIENFGANAFLAGPLTNSRMWSIYLHLISKNGKKISDFSEHREKIEREIIIGNFSDANDSIEKFKDIFGESVWYVRTKMLILISEEKTEELEEFCNNSKDRAGESLARFIFHCCQLIIGSDDPSLHLKALISRSAIEFKEAKLLETASFLELLFTPFPIKGSYDYSNSLSRLQGFPVIDQYCFILSILRLSLAEYKATNIKTIPNIDTIFKTLNDNISDPVLKKMFNNYFDISEKNTCSLGSELIENYTFGHYDRTIKIYFDNVEKIKNPLAYINLIAKSYAYLGEIPDFPTSKGILKKTILQLALIYKVDPLWMQAEEQITTTAIKYHSLTYGSHIQLALYKALPNKYEENNPKLAAYISIATDPNVTPLTYTMADQNNNKIFSHAIEKISHIPKYRIIKEEIVEFNINTDFEYCFESFKNSTPLIKDYIELISAKYLSIGKEEELILLAAPLLVSDPNRHVCFPLFKMINIIEERSICSISAVIVAFFYNRYTSPHKDYVLNESFEGFLHSMKIKKPSDLLSTIKDLNDLEVLFFKDICVSEIMDFLSCFKNTRELHAERIKILDLLLEKQALNSETRMIEVEEIIQRVIVEAGASDFNGSKIYVDGTAIKKKHSDEMISLSTLYRQAKDSGEERFTIISDEFNSVGMVQAYASGNKNTTIVKMFNLLCDAFKFDEKYGLDKNLSAEIRHGFFSNLMHARLEERKLVTEVDDNGKYKQNSYWREANSLVRDEIWTMIEADLQKFTSSFNKLIADAEEWMKIAISSDQPNRAFSYIFQKTEFDQLKNFVGITTDHEKISDYILKIIWAITEESLKKIRDSLNGAFRDNVDKLFEKLESDIKITKKTLALKELMAEIGYARNEIKEDITIAAEWFKRTEITEVKAGTLDNVLSIAISSFEQVKGGAFAIEKKAPFNLPLLFIQSNAVKPFIISIINILDNCYRHSGLGHATRVEISGIPHYNGAKIIIKNNLSQEKFNLLTPDFLSGIKEKILNADSGNLITTEGGSGLVKAHNAISSFGSNSTVTISLDKLQFCAEITYEP